MTDPDTARLRLDDTVVDPATVRDAPALHTVARAAFAQRDEVHPPPRALTETVEEVAEAIGDHGGLIARRNGEVVGGLRYADHGRLLSLERVAVGPGEQGGGLAARLVRSAQAHARMHGFEGTHVIARAELPQTIGFWERQGYTITGRNGPFLSMTRLFSVETVTRSAEETHELGVRLGRRLVAGDLVVLTGDLGAGKTTFTQGLGAGLEVRGDITSPTFVISRVHRSEASGPALVHVDAYRIAGMVEIDDLDLDTGLEEAVTVVEWGEGLVEDLAEARLEVSITRTHGGPGPDLEEEEQEGHRRVSRDAVVAGMHIDDVRHIKINPVGDRWVGAGLASVISGADGLGRPARL